MNRALLACAVALATAAALASCGSDSSKSTATTTTATTSTSSTTVPAATTTDGPPAASTTPTSYPNPPVCAPLQIISNYDLESSAKVAANDFPALTKFLIDSTPEVLTAYDQAATAQPDLADEIAILRKVSEGARDAAYEAKDISTLQTLLLEIPELQQAGTAAVTLNDFATKNCGFSTGNN
jgi:ABC-type amino acid transport substrate-binding protein